MPFNVTWDQYAQANITGFYDSFAYYNSVTEDIFGAGLMMSLYVIFMLVFSRWGMKTAFSASSFIMFVLSGILRATGLIGDTFVVFFMVATGVALFFISLPQK